MLPSSRTPEGDWRRCPVCGTAVRIEPSVPPGDAPCPCCGCLLWPSTEPTCGTSTTAGHPAGITSPPKYAEGGCSYAAIWSVSGVASAVGIGVLDRSPALAALWAVATVAWGCWGVPRLVRRAERVSAARRGFWRDVVFGWVLVPGPIAACLFGILPAWLWGWPGSAFEGCLLGLVLGPLFAAVEGLVIAGLVVVGIWLFTGKRWDRA